MAVKPKTSQCKNSWNSCQDLEYSYISQCKNSWNSCQDLGYSYIFLFTLETLDKILFILASQKPLEILDRTLGKSLIKSVKRINKSAFFFLIQIFSFPLGPLLAGFAFLHLFLVAFFTLFLPLPVFRSLSLLVARPLDNDFLRV